MNVEQKRFIESLIKISSDKTEINLTDELKEMYRVSIKTGMRKEFLSMCDRNSDAQKTIDDKVFLELGRSMFAVADLLGQYVEFSHWLEKMIGRPLGVKKLC